MAKGFPYFKFIATEWLTGDIVYEDFELQGIFINVCALYWHRDGNLTISEVKKRLKSDRIDYLIGSIINVKNDKIYINFLDEQLVEANHISKVNSENGKKGGRPKAEKPTENRTVNETKAKKSKEEEERELEEEIEVNKNKNKSVLTFPFSSNEFLKAWNILVKEPKWRKKTKTALQMSLNKLSKYSEAEAIEMINQAIIGGYQGIFEVNKNYNKGSTNSLNDRMAKVQEAFDNTDWNK